MSLYFHIGNFTKGVSIQIQTLQKDWLEFANDKKTEDEDLFVEMPFDFSKSKPNRFLQDSGRRAILLDADDLRLPGDNALILDGVQGAAHRVLGGGVGDQDNRRRRRRTFRVVAPMGPPARMPCT